MFVGLQKRSASSIRLVNSIRSSSFTFSTKENISIHYSTSNWSYKQVPGLSQQVKMPLACSYSSTAHMKKNDFNDVGANKGKEVSMIGEEGEYYESDSKITSDNSTGNENKAYRKRNGRDREKDVFQFDKMKKLVKDGDFVLASTLGQVGLSLDDSMKVEDLILETQKIEEKLKGKGFSPLVDTNIEEKRALILQERKKIEENDEGKAYQEAETEYASFVASGAGQTRRSRRANPYKYKVPSPESIGGLCKGGLQRKNKQPLRCDKIDLATLEVTNVPVLSQFLTEGGAIKPRRLSGLCSKCQRKVAKAIKGSRHMGILPHTMGVKVYKRLDVEDEEYLPDEILTELQSLQDSQNRSITL